MKLEPTLCDLVSRACALTPAEIELVWKTAPPRTPSRRQGVSPPPSPKRPPKRWRDLILRVWHVELLRCPTCQNPMWVIALIDDPRVVERILRHLAA